MERLGCRVLLWLLLTFVAKGFSQERTKSNIFDSKPIRVKDYGTPPVTSTIPLYDCSSSHRPKIDIPSAFEVYHNKEWYLQSCEEGLTWNQTLCRCEFPNGRRLVVQCRDYRATSTELTGTYEQLVNGQWIVRDCSLAVAGLVWDQEACQCVWGPNSKEMVTGQGIAPCEIMLNLTFENGVKDEAKGSFIEIGRGNPVPIFPVNKRDAPDGYKAAYFSDTALNIWYFAGNEMGTSLRVEFRFKMTNDPVQRDKYQIFISNGCNVSAPGYTTPSLAIGYRAADQSYLLAFETATARKAIVCTRKLGAYDWHTISLIYEDGTLLFRVDDNPCIISQDFSGPVQKTPCPLTIGADPLERESMYKGYLDNLLIARYCRRFMDTDPNDAKDKAKGPMLVETAPSVNDLDVQQRSSLLGKSGQSKQRGVTSSKYFPEFPILVNSESEYSERMTQNSAYLDSTTDFEKTRGFTNGFRRSVKPENDKTDFGQPESSEGGYRNEFSRYERLGEQDLGFDHSGKTNVQVNGYGQSGQASESENGYDGSGDTDGHARSYGKSGKNGYTRSDKNNDSYGYSGKRGRQTAGYGRFDDSERSPKIARQDSGYDNHEKISSSDTNDYTNSGQTGRRVNEDSNFGMNEGYDSSFQNSGRRKGKVIDFTDSAKDNNYDRKIKQNSGQDNFEKIDDSVNYNSEVMERQGKTGEKDNGFTNQEKKSRHGNKFGSSKITRVKSEDNLNSEDSFRNNQDQGKITGEANNLDSSTKIESDFGKSDENFDGYENSKDGHSYNNQRSNIDTSLWNSGKDGTDAGNDKHFVNNRKYKNSRSGKSDDNNSGITSGYEGPATGGHTFTQKSIQGWFQGDSDDHEKYEDNDDNLSSDKEGREGSESDEENENAGQINGNKNIGDTKKYENTGQGKRFENRPNKEYENKRENNRFENRQKKGYEKTKQAQGYQNTGQAIQYENGQAYRGSIQNKRASRFEEKFQGRRKLDLNTESSSDVDNGAKIPKTASRSEVGHVVLDASSYQNMIGGGSRKDNKKTDSSVLAEDKTTGQSSGKNGSVSHDTSDSKTDTEFAQDSASGVILNSNGSTPNLVKGKRRFGSKKINWYDKADTNQSSQEESNPDKQNLDDKLVDRLPASQTFVGYGNKKVIKSGSLDAADTGPGSVVLTTQNAQSNGKTNIERPNQNHRKSDIPQDEILRQGNSRQGISTSARSLSKNYNENHKDDNDLDVADVSEDGKISQATDSADEKAKISTDRPKTDSRNAQTHKPSEGRSEPKETTMGDAQKKQSDKNKSGVRMTGDGAAREQRPSKTSVLSDGKVNDKSRVKGTTSRLDMPVDVTKIRSFRSVEVTDDSLSGRTPAAPSSVMENDRSISSEKGKSRSI